MYRPLWLNFTSDTEEIISEKKDLLLGSSGSSKTGKYNVFSFCLKTREQIILKSKRDSGPPLTPLRPPIFLKRRPQAHPGLGLQPRTLLGHSECILVRPLHQPDASLQILECQSLANPVPSCPWHRKTQRALQQTPTRCPERPGATSLRVRCRARPLAANAWVRF